MEQVDVIVVGGGQAGLAMSHELSAAGVEHIVLERGRVGETWRQRWDSFCLVTPSWTVRLPGSPYAGPDPDGFMPRAEIVGVLEQYAAGLATPVRTGVTVTSVQSAPAGGFVLLTTAGQMSCRALVLATGAFQRPHRPAAAAALPSDLPQLDVSTFRNEAALPPGKVLVVGGGQSGAQISEELHQAGREVVLACGKAPWIPRRIEGRDIVWWLDKIGFFNVALEALPSPAARLTANPMVTGHGGGRDLNLRTLQALGVTLTGHLLGATDQRALFAPDLQASADWGDQRFRELTTLMKKFATENGIEVPAIDEPAPFVAPATESLDLDGFGVVIIAGGFRPDYRSWLPWSEAFDDLGFPLQRDGVSTVVPGLFFMGVHFLRTRKSSLLVGVGDDAAIVSRHVGAMLGAVR